MGSKNATINGIFIRPIDDGETHINVYSAGNTTLGRLLSNFTRFEQETPHGMFDSLEAYYHFLKLLRSIELEQSEVVINIDLLRDKWGHAAQQLGRDLRSELRQAGCYIYDTPDEVFRNCFKEALKTKITQHEELYEEFMENTLPYVHYYVINKGEVHHKKHFNWLTDIITEIQAELFNV